VHFNKFLITRIFLVLYKI